MERLTDKNRNAMNRCGEYSSCYSCHNQQDARIKELEKIRDEGNQKLENFYNEKIDELDNDYNKHLDELIEENQQLKQSQNQKAIEVLRIARNETSLKEIQELIEKVGEK